MLPSNVGSDPTAFPGFFQATSFAGNTPTNGGDAQVGTTKVVGVVGEGITTSQPNQVASARNAQG